MGGSSQRCSVMSSKALNRKARVFNQANTHARLPRLRGQSESQHEIAGAPLRAVGDRICAPLWPVTELLPFVAYTAKASTSTGTQRRTPSLGQWLKRIMDVALSALALIALSPVMLIIAMAIRLESRGSLIYRSARAGKNGRRFDCYKFRTMIDGSDELQEELRSLNERRGPFFKISDDPRITRLGRFLRKYSLDELPQFWNVVKGEMSLVGPRPHPVEDCLRYSPEDCRRLDAKPGITGLWQVLARTDPSFDVCMVLDLSYIEKWSLWLDCEILLKTVPAVLAGEGT